MSSKNLVAYCDTCGKATKISKLKIVDAQGFYHCKKCLGVEFGAPQKRKGK
jgi:hypothetical protein